MARNRYISTQEAVRLTGQTTQQIYDLIHQGVIPARKAPKSGWRILQRDLEDLGLIKNVPKSTPVASPVNPSASKQPSVPKPSPSKDEWYYVADEEHFTKVFKRMTEVKSCLKIATGDLKNFNVYVDGKKKPMRLCDFFLSLVKRGINVQIVCMKPFGFYLYAQEHCPQLLMNPLFELRLNENNHMKMFIFDDKVVYFGSANITSAAIGRRANGKRNHEAGMLVWGPNIVQAPLCHFEAVWNDPSILKSTWKRFETKAKEFEKLRG